MDNLQVRRIFYLGEKSNLSGQRHDGISKIAKLAKEMLPN